MEFFQQNKKIVISAGVALAVVVIYFSFFSGSKPALKPTDTFSNVSAGGLVSEISVSPTDVLAGGDLLLALSQMKNVSLDTSILSDPAFKSLVDTGKAIDPEPYGKSTGRTNPFSGFGQ